MSRMTRMSWTAQMEDAVASEMWRIKPYNWGAGLSTLHPTASAGWAKFSQALENRETYPCFYNSDIIHDFPKKVQEKATSLVVDFRKKIEVHPWRLAVCFDAGVRLPYPANFRHSCRIIRPAPTGADSSRIPPGRTT